jgi:hypothetical protein
MIVLPTRHRLERRRDALYQHLQSILQTASVSQVEAIMRRIHCINLRLRTYFIREGQYETKETFNIQDTIEAQDFTAL